MASNTELDNSDSETIDSSPDAEYNEDTWSVLPDLLLEKVHIIIIHLST